MSNMYVTDDQLARAIQAKMGYQERVSYCRDCCFSAPNPDPVDRRLALICKHNNLVQFPTAKMATCRFSEIAQTADQTDNSTGGSASTTTNVAAGPKKTNPVEEIGGDDDDFGIDDESPPPSLFPGGDAPI